MFGRVSINIMNEVGKRWDMHAQQESSVLKAYSTNLPIFSRIRV